MKTVVNTSPTLGGSSTALPVDGLASPAVEQGSNLDSAVEFEFRRPVKLAGIWLREEVGKFHQGIDQRWRHAESSK